MGTTEQKRNEILNENNDVKQEINAFFRVTKRTFRGSLDKLSVEVLKSLISKIMYLLDFF